MQRSTFVEFLRQPRLEYSSCVSRLFRTSGAEMNFGKHLCVLAYHCPPLSSRSALGNETSFSPAEIDFLGHRQEAQNRDW